MTRDPLSAARGIGLGLFTSTALILFLLGAAFAAGEAEDAGAICMVLACISSILAIIIGANHADTTH